MPSPSTAALPKTHLIQHQPALMKPDSEETNETCMPTVSYCTHAVLILQASSALGVTIYAIAILFPVVSQDWGIHKLSSHWFPNNIAINYNSMNLTLGSNQCLGRGLTPRNNQSGGFHPTVNQSAVLQFGTPYPEQWWDVIHVLIFDVIIDLGIQLMWDGPHDVEEKYMSYPSGIMKNTLMRWIPAR